MQVLLSLPQLESLERIVTELGVEQCISLYRVKGDDGERLGPASCHLPGQCHIRRVPDSWLSKLGVYSIL